MSYKLSTSISILALVLLVVLFVVIRRDIRRERKAKERLQGIIRENKELLEMRKNIILTVSHDIRGPLGNIANCAELASGTPSKKKRDGYLYDISRSCAHALRLGNRLLDVYKTFEQDEPLDEVPFRLAALLDDISDDFKRKANAKELMFEYECVECTACRNAREAVEALGRADYDLVLTDVQMPYTDGFGLLKLLRTADIGCSRTVPVAVMTARGDGDSDVYLQAGFCGCLHKPFSMRQLTAFLSSCVAHESHRPKFNFEGLLEHTGDRRHMLEVLLRQSEDDKADLEKALAGPDREALRAVTHRMLSAWSFLGADGLIEDFRKVVVDASVDDESIRNETAKLVYAIECLIGEVKALIENEK